MDSKLFIIYQYILILKREFLVVNYMYDLVKKRYKYFIFRIEIMFLMVSFFYIGDLYSF